MKRPPESILPKESLILVLDDAPENLKILERLLAKQGYRIQMCQSGLEALQTASRPVTVAKKVGRSSPLTGLNPSAT